MANVAVSKANKYSPKERFEFFFTGKTKDAKGIVKFICRVCNAERKEAKNSGYTNYETHIFNTHSNHEQLMDEQRQSGGQQKLIYVSEKAQKAYEWIRFVVNANQPFCIVEDPDLRVLTKHHICRNTLTDYIEAVVDEEVRVITAELPNSFGIIFDGWAEGGKHYVAFMAVFPNKGGKQVTRLLSIAPLDDEESLDAASYAVSMKTVLEQYGKDLEHVSFIVCDNCSVNKRLARDTFKPMIGCASHRLNLAVGQFLTNQKDTIEAINNLMKKLSTYRGTAKLSKLTPLKAVQYVATRWSSAYDMMERFFTFVDVLDRADRYYCNLIPSEESVSEMKEVFKQMKVIQSVTKRIQAADVTMSDVRILFDSLMVKIPSLASHIAADAPIVEEPNFESGLVKIQQHNEANLHYFEKLLLRPWLLSSQSAATAEAAEEDEDFATQQLKKQRSSSEQPASRYCNLDWIPPTSNVCERLFSQAGLVLTDVRKRLSEDNFDRLLRLKVNRDMWDVQLVNRALIAREEKAREKKAAEAVVVHVDEVSA